MGKAINSVPLLTREWRVQGYIWLVQGSTHGGLGNPTLPEGVQYIGGALGDAILVATQERDLIWPPGMLAEPWKMQSHNDPAGTIPFATLDDAGQYAHLESFRMSFDEDAKEPDLQWCTFFCGQTTGQEKLCPD
jgi:hypothetical protein